MKRVLIESPLKGDYEANREYARRCMRDSLKRGEAPLASHLLYDQTGILDDRFDSDRRRGMQAGFTWGAMAELVAVYIDLGISDGMLEDESAECYETHKPTLTRQAARQALQSPRSRVSHCADRYSVLADHRGVLRRQVACPLVGTQTNNRNAATATPATITPITRAKTHGGQMAERTQKLRLGEVLRKWRKMCELDLRVVADQMGLGASTLMRIERGGSCDAETLIKILAWLMTDSDSANGGAQEGAKLNESTALGKQ